MRWRKLGLTYDARNYKQVGYTHAMVPTPLRLNNGTLRVFITSLDKAGIGRPFYIDIDPLDPQKVLNVSRKPLLGIGTPGTFDDNGILACSVIEKTDGTLYMYYVGFEICNNIRYLLECKNVPCSDS